MSDRVKALRFRQWLPEWDEFDYDQQQHRRKPDGNIYLFSMPAIQLRALSGVYRRTRGGEGDAEGLQRGHDKKRSAAISEFVRFGHPYSTLPDAARTDDAAKMRKPGWLPTAIVVNILGADDQRKEKKVAAGDLVRIEEDSAGGVELVLPYSDALQKWKPAELEPFEVIDGQHRLWAFDEALEDGSLPGDFELPVVAFSGLDIGWQAYLFWSINVSPKRINPSHAFDLFPLLRSAEWLETLSELKIYRQARAQELTEILFTHPDSPFQNRINMLGESRKDAPVGARVSQAGWVQSLSTSFLSTGAGRSANGLFAADISPTSGPLDWSRPQQAAFLIALWGKVRDFVLEESEDWIKKLIDAEAQPEFEEQPNPAFFGKRTMLNQEQGVRGINTVANEIFFALAQQNIEDFRLDSDVRAGTVTQQKDVSLALTELLASNLSGQIEDLAKALSSFDWRSADAPNLTDEEELTKRAFRGSGGYVALRKQLFSHLVKESRSFKQIATESLGRLS